MSISKIKCSLVTCKNCNNHILIKDNIWGDNECICNSFPEIHEVKNGEDCRHFICNNYSENNNDFCKGCNGGNIKILIK